MKKNSANPTTNDLIERLSLEQLLKNIVISENANSRSYKKFIWNASKFDSPQSRMFNRIVSLLKESDGVIESKEYFLVLDVSHGENPTEYVGLYEK